MLNYNNLVKKILLVDDEATLLFFLRQTLSESNAHYTVDAASTGEEAISRLHAQQYNLLITDLKMPGISGFTLIEAARSLQPDIRVILMTAFDSWEIEHQTQNLQVEGYLTKPFPIAQLSTLAHQLLAPAPLA
jgi:YesN/AraC family two-component response regulator